MADEEESEQELPPLVHAVCNYDLQQVRVLMKRTDDRYNRHWALLKAVKRRSLSIVRFFLDQRIYHKHDQKLWSYNCLMRYAYESGDISMVKLLMVNGADPYIGAFHITSTGRRKDPTDVQMEVLLNKEMEFQLSANTKECYLGWFGILQRRQIERSLMFCAICNGDTDMIRLVLEFDGCESRSNDIRYFAVFAAHTIGDEAEAKANELVKWCLADDRHFIDKTLERIILDGEIEHVKILLRYLTNINANMAETVMQETPVILAVRIGRTDICDLLLQNGADINMVSERYQDYTHNLPPPRRYKFKHDLPVLSRLTRPLLVALGRNYDDGDTKYNLAYFLLNHGADPNLPDGEGKTPLHYAVHHRASNETIKMLLQHGAEANPIDKSIGHSILSRLLEIHHCDYDFNYYDDNYFKRACLFIWAGADVGVYYSWGRMKIDTARVGKWRKILGLLRRNTEWVHGYRIEWWRTRYDECVVKCILLLLDSPSSTCTSKLNLVTSLVMSGSLTRSDISKLYDEIRQKVDWRKLTGECQKYVEGFLKDFLARGYTLQELCRLKLRESIQPPLWTNVMSDHIQLPKRLKAYLLNEDAPDEKKKDTSELVSGAAPKRVIVRPLL